MEERKILKLIYTFFIGVFLALFVGVGISAFYESPIPPKYPSELNMYSKEPTAAQIAAQKEFDKKNEIYQATLKPYNRNVSMMALIASVILFAGGMLLQSQIHVLADGLMLGGLLTLLYSVGRGFAAENSKYMFALVTIGLAIMLYLGYDRFLRERHSVVTTK